MGTQRKAGAILSYLNIFTKNIVNFLYTPFLLRFVGQADYGLFQMVNTVMISMSLLSMGFSSSYIRFYMLYKVNKNESKIEKLNAIYIIIFSCISIISFIIGSILILNTNSIFGRSLSQKELILTHKLLIILVLDTGISFLSTVFDSNVSANERFVFQQGRQLILTFLVPVISVPLILMGVGVFSIAVTQLLVTVVYLLLNIRYCLTKLNMKFDFSDLPIKLFKDLSFFSFYIFLNQVVDLVNNNMPSFILGITQGAKLVATFSIAVQIKNMFFMLSQSLSNVFIPKIHKMVDEGTSSEKLTDIMIRVGRIQMSLLFFVLGGFIVIGKYFVKVWAGNENIEAYYLIIFMVLPSIIPLSQNLGIEIQRAMNKHKFRSIVYMLFAFNNLILTYEGSLKFGLFGGCVGYVISMVFANGLIMNWYYGKKIQINIKRYFRESFNVTIPFFIATFFGIVVQNYISINSVSSFFLFGIIYVGIYFAIYMLITSNEYERNLLFGKFK